MKLINYFLDNIDKYYQYLSNDLINNISNIKLNEVPHINLYGNNSSVLVVYFFSTDSLYKLKNIV